MSSWRDYAHGATVPLGCAKSAISAESPPVRPVKAPNGTNGTNGTLLDTVSKGLALLANAPAPRLRRADVWPQVVNDALRLASEGWADQAMRCAMPSPRPMRATGRGPTFTGVVGIALRFSGTWGGSEAVNEEPELDPDGVGFLVTYELPGLDSSEWGAIPIVDEGWDK